MSEQSSGANSRPLVLYIGGFGRSGSTLLERLLAQIPRLVPLGEVTHLWERGIVLDQLCACGEAFHACPFWSQVGERAFGGWDRVDMERVRHLKGAVDRNRHLPATLRRRPSPSVGASAREYADLYRRIYGAAQEVSGASVVIDSSKEAPTAAALSHHDSIDLRVVHIVRDSRGVAYSWSKSVLRPETHGAEEMPRFSARESTQWWLTNNLAIDLLGRRGVPVHRIRYEDMLADLPGTLAGVWDALALPGKPDLPMIDERTVELSPSHSVAGNPMRFRTGPTTLRTDDAWRTELAPHARRITTALSYPVLKRYGYV